MFGQLFLDVQYPYLKKIFLKNFGLTISYLIFFFSRSSFLLRLTILIIFLFLLLIAAYAECFPPIHIELFSVTDVCLKE